MENNPFEFKAGATANKPSTISSHRRKPLSTISRATQLRVVNNAFRPCALPSIVNNPFRPCVHPTSSRVPDARLSALKQDLDAQATLDQSRIEDALALKELAQLGQPDSQPFHLSREKHVAKLTAALTTAVQLFCQTEETVVCKFEASVKLKLEDRQAAPTHEQDVLTHLHPITLARAWELKTWTHAHETTFDFDKYVEVMEQEIGDLEMWLQHWDDELDGAATFREHVMRGFGDEVEAMGKAKVAKKKEEMWDEVAEDIMKAFEEDGDEEDVDMMGVEGRNGAERDVMDIEH